MGENNNIQLGFRLKEARERSGKNQTEFAKMIGVSPAHLNRWEKGSISPGWEYLASISNKTGVSLDWLLTGQYPKYKDGSVELPYKREFDWDATVMYRTEMGMYSEEQVISHISGDPPRIRVYATVSIKPFKQEEAPVIEEMTKKLNTIFKNGDFDSIVKVRGTIEVIYDQITKNK